MNSTKITPLRTIKKLHIEAAALFAIENIAGVDEGTLQKFVELINVTGNFGTMCEEELLEKIRLFRKYIPKACGFSLYILTELLEIDPYPKTDGKHTAMLTVNNGAIFMSQPIQPEIATTMRR